MLRPKLLLRKFPKYCHRRSVWGAYASRVCCSAFAEQSFPAGRRKLHAGTRAIPGPIGGVVRQQVYLIARGEYDRCDIGGFDPGIPFLPLFSSEIGDAGGSVESGAQSTGRHSCRPDVSLRWGLAAAIGAVAGMMAAPIVYLDPI